MFTIMHYRYITLHHCYDCTLMTWFFMAWFWFWCASYYNKLSCCWLANLNRLWVSLYVQIMQDNKAFVFLQCMNKYCKNIYLSTRDIHNEKLTSFWLCLHLLLDTYTYLMLFSHRWWYHPYIKDKLSWCFGTRYNGIITVTVCELRQCGENMPTCILQSHSQAFPTPVINSVAFSIQI